MAVRGKNIFFYGLEDDQVDDFVSSLRFQGCAGGHAKFLVRKKTRFLYVNCGEFGLLRGRGTKSVKPSGDVARSRFYWTTGLGCPCGYDFN